MECLECGKSIIGRRADSKYCSKTCANRAKQKRSEQRLIESVSYSKPVYPPANQSLYGFDEIRELEKDKFVTILELKERFGNQIKQLETSVLNKDFEISRLKDRIEDLHRTHDRELQSASTNTVKETVHAITAMPAIQGALGALATNLMPSENSPLGGVSEVNEVEKQILQSIRKMQPEAQQYLVQMLYFLFAKSNDEQIQIFSTLSQFIQGDNEQNNDNDLP